MFKAEICKDNYSNSTLTLQQIVQLLVKHYNGSQIPAIKKNSKRKYKNITHIDEKFIPFFYFDKTRLHYDRTLYRTGIYEDIVAYFTDKISV